MLGRRLHARAAHPPDKELGTEEENKIAITITVTNFILHSPLGLLCDKVLNSIQLLKTKKTKKEKRKKSIIILKGNCCHSKY